MILGISAHTPIQMITALEDMMFERLQIFQKTNKRLPDRILVYRDGVSEVSTTQL
jgi:hypothetical protein